MKNKLIKVLLALIVVGSLAYLITLNVDLLGVYNTWRHVPKVEAEQVEPEVAEIPHIEELKAWQQSNKEVRGWLAISNTEMSMPLVQTGDNDYYMNHDATGNYNPNGAAFIDYEVADLTEKPDHIIVYGHNMANHQVFSDLEKYVQDASFLDTHSQMIVSTEKGYTTYEVVMVSRIDITNEANFFPFNTWLTWQGEDNAATYAQEMMRRSIHRRQNVTVYPTDRLLTLSTCDNAAVDARYVVVCKAVGEKEITA